jgi:hypothetical protein
MLLRHAKVYLRRHVQDSGVDVRREDLVPFVLDSVSQIADVMFIRKGLTQSMSMSRSLGLAFGAACMFPAPLLASTLAMVGIAVVSSSSAGDCWYWLI